MRSRSILRYLGRVLLLFAAYFLTGKLGLWLNSVSRFATLVWAPTGISLGLLLLFGSELWPGVFLGAWVVNRTTGAPWSVALGLACGNTLEAVIGAYGLRRFVG